MEVQRMWWGPEKGNGVSAFRCRTQCGRLRLSPVTSHSSERRVSYHPLHADKPLLVCEFVPLITVCGMLYLDKPLVPCLKIGDVVLASSVLVCLRSRSDVSFNVGLICDGGEVLQPKLGA